MKCKHGLKVGIWTYTSGINTHISPPVRFSFIHSSSDLKMAGTVHLCYWLDQLAMLTTTLQASLKIAKSGMGYSSLWTRLLSSSQKKPKKKPRSMSISTTKAGYIALGHGSREGMWISRFLKEMALDDWDNRQWQKQIEPVINEEPRDLKLDRAYDVLRQLYPRIPKKWSTKSK